jgi:hypothetical protein
VEFKIHPRDLGILRGGYFILRRGEEGKMDMESDMCDGDMNLSEIFRAMIINHPPLNCIANRIKGAEKKGAGGNESVQGQ